MRRSWATWLSACVVLLACAAPAAAAQKTTRVFVMQPKLDLGWMDQRETFHDKMFALADRTMRVTGSPIVQRGAQDVASNLRPDGRNLVVWPEDMGLWAAFTGERGRSARQSGSLIGAVATLFGAYSPQMSAYAGRYPDVAARTPQVRLLALALTDTFGRVTIETFAEMAAKYRVWLEVGVNMTQSWRVVCVGGAHPPQQPCDEENPAKVQELRDPSEPTRAYAYEATSPDVSNMALVFDPSGRLHSRQIKNYVTPIELGQAEGQLAALDLVPGAVTGGLTAVPTPVGTLGFVTSKDAWMPDVVDKLEDAGVDLLVQPEFFVGDLARPTGMWSADTLKASGYNDVLRHPGIQSLSVPSAVGNVFDFSADQQAHIAERPRQAGGGSFLIGQAPAPGLVAVTPWVVPDPVRPDEPFGERRRRLADAGAKLAPGSGVRCPSPSDPGACENGHVEAVLWRDVPVGAPDYDAFADETRRTPFGTAARIGGRNKRVQRNAAVALNGRYGAIAYEDLTAAGRVVRVATTVDAGRSWTRARQPATRRGDGRQPAVAVGADGRVTVAWVEQHGTVPRVVFAQSKPRAGAFAKRAARAIDARPPAGVAQWKPALAQGPGRLVHAAFVDERARSQDGNLPQAGIYYSRINAGRAEAPKRMDEGQPAPLAAKLDHAWAPSLAARGRDVLLTWIDFMSYDWDVLSRLSRDGGAGFAKQVLSTRQPSGVENLSDSPKAVFTTRGPLIAWTDWQKRDSIDRPHPQYDTYLASPGREPVQADPHGPAQVSTFWPAACAHGRDALVAFQDSSTGLARVRITRMRGGAKRGRPRAVSDATAEAYRPAMACSAGRVVVAWEDARNGRNQIYAAATALKSIK